ncbi:MAG: thiosulfate oxidation carrier protein SoxY [Betaproteobacteria bacterium]
MPESLSRDNHDIHDSQGIHVASRRRALGALAAGIGLIIVRPARATPEDLVLALREAFGDRQIARGRVSLEIPRLAENGNVVPVIVRVESAMTPQDHVTGISLFAEKNQLPRMLDVRLGPYNGKAVVSSRIRVATSQQITAVAQLSDGSLWSASAEIEVVTSDCGL